MQSRRRQVELVVQTRSEGTERVKKQLNALKQAQIATQARRDRLDSVNQQALRYKRETREVAELSRELRLLEHATGVTAKQKTNLAKSMIAAKAAAKDAKAEYRAQRAALTPLKAQVEGGFKAFSRMADSIGKSSVEARRQKTDADKLGAGLNRLKNNTANVTKEQARLAAQTNRTTSGFISQAAQQRRNSTSTGQGTGLAEREVTALTSRKGRGILGLRPYELTNLSYQINDVVSGFAQGQRPMQIFAQQAGQIIQIFPKITTAIFRFAPVIGILAPFVIALRDIAKEGENLRFFASNLNLMANGAQFSSKELAKLATDADRTGLSLKDARAIVLNFAKRDIDTSSIEQLITMSKQLASVTGESVPEAGEKLAKAFSGGAEGVRELDRELNFLTSSQLENVNALFKSGNAADAVGIAQDALADKLETTANLAKSDGPWARAAGNPVSYTHLTLPTICSV